MNTETKAKRISGMTISCDHCANTALYRSESKAPVGFAVHWTCRDCVRTAA